MTLRPGMRVRVRDDNDRAIGVVVCVYAHGRTVGVTWLTAPNGARLLANAGRWNYGYSPNRLEVAQ